MSGILKFCGGAVLLLSALGIVLVAFLGLAGGAWSQRGGVGVGLAAFVAGGLGTIFQLAQTMAAGATMFVGGHALDYMARRREIRPRARVPSR